MLLMSWLAPQEISLAFRKSPEIHGRAPLWSVLRAAYASDEGLATFTRGTRGGAHNATLAEPAKLKLGLALPRACSTDSPIRPLGACFNHP